MRQLLAAFALLIAVSASGCERELANLPFSGLLEKDVRVPPSDERYSPYSIDFKRQNAIAKRESDKYNGVAQVPKRNDGTSVPAEFTQ